MRSKDIKFGESHCGTGRIRGYCPPESRSVAQPGRALALGARRRRFKSCRSDHFFSPLNAAVRLEAFSAAGLLQGRHPARDSGGHHQGWPRSSLYLENLVGTRVLLKTSGVAAGLDFAGLQPILSAVFVCRMIAPGRGQRGNRFSVPRERDGSGLTMPGIGNT